MGQKIGKPVVVDCVQKFTNLPREALESLWSSYNLLGEGWGIDLIDFGTIIGNSSFFTENLEISEQDIELLFNVLDTDKNGMIDVLECIAVLCIVSGMDTIDKLFFAFSLYDFERTGALSHNGVTLLLRSIFSGFGKLCKSDTGLPSESEISGYADLIFKDANKSTNETVTAQEFQHYCTLHPVVASWIRFMSLISWPTVNKYESEINKADSDNEETLNAVSKAKKFIQKKSRNIHGSLSDGAVNRSWFELASKMLPDELPPTATRKDLPEDVLEPVWVHGYTANSTKTCARYGGSKGANGQYNILFPVGNAVLSMNKNDETQQWIQNSLAQHNYPIVCMETSGKKKFAATADCVDGRVSSNVSITADTSTVIIWDLKSGAPHGVIQLAFLTSVRCLDFSSDERYLLVVGNDDEGSVLVYDTNSLKVVYSTTMSVYQTNKLEKSRILDAKFWGTSSMFCVANGTGDGSLNCFVEEDGNYMGDGKCKIYNHHFGAFQAMGNAAEGIPITCLSKFEFPDELIVANASGHVMYWRGRCCLQLIKAHENKSVTALSYDPNSKLLVSGGKDNKIRLYNIQAVSLGKKDRAIEIVGMIDVVGSSRDIISASIRSLCLSVDGSRVLVSVKSGEVLELSCKNGSSAPVGGEEEGNASVGVKLGDDVNGAPLNKSHWNRLLTNTTSQQEDATPVLTCVATTAKITGVCKAPGGFLSCGADGVVRKWQEAEGAPHTCTKHVGLDSGCSVMAASRTAAAIAFDGILNAERKDTVQILSANDLSYLATLNGQEGGVTFMQFSGDGNSLAVCGVDFSINIYGSSDGATNWNSKGKLTGHQANVVGVDFSSDGQFVRSIDNSDTAFVWDVAANFGSEVSSRDILKMIQWSSHSCPVSWELKGVWNGFPSSERMACCDRFNHLFVSGLSSGEVQITRCPTTDYLPNPNALNFRKVFAHFGGVSSVCFLEEGLKLVTAGALDGCIQVWNVVFDVDEPEPDVLPVAEGEEPVVDEPPPEDAEDELDENGLPKPKFIYYDSADDEDLVDGASNLQHICKRKKHVQNEGDIAQTPSCSSDGKDSRVAAFSALANWVDSSLGLPLDNLIIQSANTTRDLNFAVNEELGLHWIHGGYACRSTRGSVRYSRQGKIIYPAGRVAVSLNKVNTTQTHFCSHDADISALEIHQASGIAASAQLSRDNVLLCIWDSDSCSCLRRLDCGQVNGVSAIAFSPDGAYVAVACLDFAHTILIFDWKNSSLHAKFNGGAKKVLNLCFSSPYVSIPAATNADGEKVAPPPVPNVNNKSLRLIQGGVLHFNLIDVKQQHCVNSKTGLYGAGIKKTNVLCSAALPLPAEGGNEFVVGFSNGTMGVISKGDKRIGNIVPVLERGSITALWVLRLKEATAEEPPLYQLVVGGTQGHIKILDMEFAPVSEFNIYAHDAYSLYPIGQVFGIKSLCGDKSNRKLLIGTGGGEILEIQVQNGDDVNGAPLVHSHFCGKLLALDTHPTRQECVTVSDDKTLRIWDLEKQVQMNKIALPDIARSVCFAPNGFLIGVGLGANDLRPGRTMPRENDGKVLIISYMQDVLRIIHETIDTNAPITTVLFSPDSSILYAGSMDKKVIMYDALNNFSIMGIISDVATQSIRCLDISVDGNLLAIQGNEDELILYQLNQRVAHERYDNLVVSNQTEFFGRRITIGADSVGVFPQYGSSSDVTCLNRSKDKSFLATGDVWGNVSIFQNPCPLPLAPCKSYKAHTQSGGVSQICFSADDKYLISIGKMDRSIMQWKLNRSSINTMDALPVGGLLPKRKPKKAVVSGDGNRNNFDAANFTIGGVSFVKELDRVTTPLDLRVTEVFGCNQANGSRVPVSYYAGTGDIISCAGNVPFMISKDKTAQTVWNATSSNDIAVMTVSDDARYVFVGDCDLRAANVDVFAKTSKFVGSLRVLDAVNGTQISVIDSNIYGGVSAIAGSPCGRYVACIGNDAQNSLYLYHSTDGLWQADATKLFSGAVSMQSQQALSFIFQSSNGKASGDALFSTINSKDSYQLVTGGAAYLRFWKLHGNGTLAVAELAEYNTVVSTTAADGTVSTVNGYKENVITTGAISIGPGQVVTTDSMGTIYFWSGKKCTSSIENAHSGSINTIIRKSSGPGYGFLTASDDCVTVWNGEVPLRSFAIGDLIRKVNLPSWTGKVSISSVAVDAVMKRMLLGINTVSSVVVEVAIDSEAVLLLTEGNVGSTIASVSHPTNPAQFVTGSSTGCIKVWDRGQSCTGNKCIEQQIVDMNIISLTFINSGQSLVVSGNKTEVDGRISSFVLFLSYTNGKLSIVKKLNIDSVHGTISNIRFSVDENILIISTTAPSLLIYDRPESGNYEYVGRVPLPNIQVGIDFSSDNRFVRTFSQTEYLTNETGVELPQSAPSDIHFYDLQASGMDAGVCGRELTSTDMLEMMLNQVVWSTISSPFISECKGLVDAANQNGEIITSIQLSKDLRSVVAGYNSGAVRLFSFPCYNVPIAANEVASRHSGGSNVNVMFNADGTSVLSVGSIDGAVFAWKL